MPYGRPHCVIESSLQYIPASKMVIGFEPGLQAYTGVSGGVEHEKNMIAQALQRKGGRHHVLGRQRGRSRAERQDDGRGTRRARELRGGALVELLFSLDRRAPRRRFSLLFSCAFPLSVNERPYIIAYSACPAPSSAGPYPAPRTFAGLSNARASTSFILCLDDLPAHFIHALAALVEVVVREQRALELLAQHLVPALRSLLPSSQDGPPDGVEAL